MLCSKSILLDFFRHAFDGSGADNFYDAGKKPLSSFTDKKVENA